MRVRSPLALVLLLILVTLTCLVSTSCVLRPPAIAVPERGALVLENVTVINPALDRASGRRVSIDGGRITAIDAAPLSAQGSYAGMFVLPGLVDMHAHYPTPLSVGVRESASLLFLAHGVTTIRDTGSLGREPGDTRRRIRAGEFPGPRMFICGPAIDGDPPSHPLTKSVADPASARELVDALAGEVDCIKVYSRLSRESLMAIREAATRHGLTLVGHVPGDVTLAESSLDDAQHLYGIAEKRPFHSFADTWGAWDRVDDARIAEVIATSLEHDIAHTPTLVHFERLSRVYELAESQIGDSGALPHYFADVVWHPERGFPAILDLTPKDLERLSDSLPKMRRLVGRMHEAGVRLHIGSDCFMPYVVPGESIAGEMAEFESAGIPLLEVWAIATRGAGEALGVPLLGRITPGAPADLLVFREDPTESLDAIETLELVIADGRAYTREEIDTALALHAKHVRSRTYRAIMHPVIRSLYWVLR